MFCNKKADFKCGNCQEAYYCSPEHQRADWPSHKRRCIKPEEKLNELKKFMITNKKLFFEKLSKGDLLECERVCEIIMNVN